jgi:hypothetical protein
MSILLRTHKMLWGRSGNTCAFPNCKKELVMDISETDDISIIGEEAHIVSRETNGPRGISPLSEEQRDKFGNLILMCSIHHKIIDDNPETYSVELLHKYKNAHENWVKQALNMNVTKQQEDEVYASYVDEILALLDVENYNAWTSYLLSGDQPRLDVEQYERLRKLLHYIISRVWYKRYPELESAIFNLKNVLNDLLKVFDEYAERVRNDEVLLTRKFYKIDRWDEELYHSLHKKYMYHVDLVLDMTMELTRSVNYIFEKVRKCLFPSFRIKEGLLLIQMGPFMDFSWRTYAVQYKQEEKIETPYPGLKKFMEIRAERDHTWGEGISEDYFPLIF